MWVSPVLLQTEKVVTVSFSNEKRGDLAVWQQTTRCLQQGFFCSTRKAIMLADKTRGNMRALGHFHGSPCFRSAYIPNYQLISRHSYTQLSTFYSGGFQLLRLENPSTATRGLRSAPGRTCRYRGNSRAAIWVERPWRRHPGTSLRHARRNLIGTIGRVWNCAWAAWFRSSRIGGGARRARYRRGRGGLRTRRGLRICLS